MGKVVSVYLKKSEYERLKKLTSRGVAKKDALARVLADRKRSLREQHTQIIKLLEEIRDAPVLQLGPGPKVPVVTVKQKKENLPFWRRLFKRKRRSGFCGDVEENRGV